MFEGCANRLWCNFVERHSKNLFRIGRGNFLRRFFSFLFFFRIHRLRLTAKARGAGLLLFEFVRLRKDHRQVRGNRLAFAVRVARQIDGLGGIRRFFAGR